MRRLIAPRLNQARGRRRFAQATAAAARTNNAAMSWGGVRRPPPCARNLTLDHHLTRPASTPPSPYPSLVPRAAPYTEFFFSLFSKRASESRGGKDRARIAGRRRLAGRVPASARDPSNLGWLSGAGRRERFGADPAEGAGEGWPARSRGRWPGACPLAPPPPPSLLSPSSACAHATGSPVGLRSGLRF